MLIRTSLIGYFYKYRDGSLLDFPPYLIIFCDHNGKNLVSSKYDTKEKRDEVYKRISKEINSKQFIETE